MIKVLAVDDDPDVLLVMKMILMDADVDFQGACSLAEAVRKVDGANVVFADLNCGQTNGIDVIRMSRETLGPSAKIYLMSADETDEAIKAARQAGADDFLPKPFPPGALLRCVGQSS